jgi:sigma-B regulation protein RsbU (phosphoserine phosphatase)
LLPSGEPGGDLIDLAGTEDRWAAYVADVSGHGIAPGIVMAMVNSAARMLLRSGHDTERLLPRLNEILFPLKGPEMFVTAGFLAEDGDGLRARLAGHPAILHFSPKTNDVVQLECPNLPLGIVPSREFVSSAIRARTRIGLRSLHRRFEAANAGGEQFGVKRLQAEFQNHATEPLDMICRLLQQSVARHGAQRDDQSLLLIRQL